MSHTSYIETDKNCNYLDANSQKMLQKCYYHVLIHLNTNIKK